MRAFIGAPLGEVLQETCEALQDAMPPDGRFVDPAHFHVTLAFMEDISERVVEDIADLLDGLEGEVALLQGAGVDTFGGPEGTRNVHLRIAPDDGLMQLERRVARICRDAGADLRRRRFVPHVTLMRRTAAPMLPDLERFVAARTALSGVPENVERVVLWRSRLTPEGPVYTALHSVDLMPDWSMDIELE